MPSTCDLHGAIKGWVYTCVDTSGVHFKLSHAPNLSFLVFDVMRLHFGILRSIHIVP
jgi:hypothetical protein